MELLDWGLIDYEEALFKQEALVEKVAAEKLPGYLIFCSHNPIVTLGSKTQPDDVFAWDGPIKEVARGGRATYHGPSQLVIYVIKPVTDIAHHLRTIENAIIDTLKLYGIEAHGKTNNNIFNENDTGVWVGSKKIASVGIGVRKWVAYHGAAINLDEDPKAFYGMNPCGFKSEVMISLEKITGKRLDIKKATRSLFLKHCGNFESKKTQEI